MPEPEVAPLTTRAECEAQFKACIAASTQSLAMFDPDFAVFPLGASDVDAALRAFLIKGGTLRLAAHTSAYIERHYPRFLRLLRDFQHRIECRVTNRGLHHLTDSFCIGDGSHIVRRFHSDHMRGEAAFDNPEATELARERFEGIWEEARAALHPTTTGL